MVDLRAVLEVTGYAGVFGIILASSLPTLLHLLRHREDRARILTAVRGILGRIAPRRTPAEPPPVVPPREVPPL